MKYFDIVTSNTYAGSGNQLYFNMPEKEVRTGRVFYKISVGGTYNYSILFSNVLDSTYGDGSVGHANMICDNWTIHAAKIGRGIIRNAGKDVADLFMEDGNEASDVLVSDFCELSFAGQKQKEVMPGEFFSADPISFSFEKDEYLCLEIMFSGSMIPYHEETLLPVFLKDGEGWKYANQMPFAGMIGCDRPVKGRIAYLGDSITQGIGTKQNSYLHWNAVLSEKLGSEYSYWNLGLGCGRASDAASDGAWLYKAKQNDIVFVCYGVNDILQKHSEEQIKADLTYLVKTLKNAGKKVILQTVPPFEYEDEEPEKWERVNAYIKAELKDQVDFLFDNTLLLGHEDNPAEPIYGGHPDESGCALWANSLYEALCEKEIL